MKEITKLMINEFKLRQLGYDFMGYRLKRRESLSFHHLIIPNREGGPYARWNGAILNQDTSHDYLHVIERVEPEIFYLITSEMIDMNIKGYLDMENLQQIKILLEQFELEHRNDVSKKGKRLIKREYIADRLIK